MNEEMLHKLIKRLREGDNKNMPYPMTPENAAFVIVEELLPDVPRARKDAVMEAISAWGYDYASAVSYTAAESTYC